MFDVWALVSRNGNFRYIMPAALILEHQTFSQLAKSISLPLTALYMECWSTVASDATPLP
jgi:hypothetical protein